jgi:hypothetical protein
MRRTALAALVTAIAVPAFGVAPAAAVPPQQIPLTEVHNPVQDDG